VSSWVPWLFYNGSVLIFFVKPAQTFLFCIANVGVLISFGTAGASEEDRRRGAPCIAYLFLYTLACVVVPPSKF
jgi:hypothetical protein